MAIGSVLNCNSNPRRGNNRRFVRIVNLDLAQTFVAKLFALGRHLENRTVDSELRRCNHRYAPIVVVVWFNNFINANRHSLHEGFVRVLKFCVFWPRNRAGVLNSPCLGKCFTWLQLWLWLVRVTHRDDFSLVRRRRHRFLHNRLS